MATPLDFRGFPYKELRGSGNFGTDSDAEQQRTERIYLADWSVAYDLAQALVGLQTNSGGGLQTFKPPQQDPERSWLFARTVQVEGLSLLGQDGVTGAITYKKARLTVSFETRTNDQQDPDKDVITFMTESKEASAEALTIPEDKLIWGPNAPKAGKVIGDDAVNFVRNPTTKLSLNISFWFDAPLDLTFEDAQSSVNRDDIQILQTLYPKGKLKFGFGRRTRQFTTQGVEAWQVNLTMTYRRNEWNKTFDPDSGQFEEYETAAGTVIHPEIDFRRLFPVGLVTI